MIYEVIVDVASSDVDRVFDYSYGGDIAVGTRVLVPFGVQTLLGFVVGKKEVSDFKGELKPIINVCDDFAAVKPEMLALASYMKENFNLRAIDVLWLFVHPKLRKISKARIVERRVPLKNFVREDKRVELTAAQKGAVESILNKKGVTLLHGVTGSGKTEIYMAVIARVLEEGKSAIILVPEISLTPQLLGVFRARFFDNVAVLHSGLSEGERADEWFRLHRGEAKIAIGARSAIFAPLDNLGVIIIDEEHENSYQSEDNPRYSAHEIALFRAEYNNASLVLGSATPSLASYKAALDGKFSLITLSERVNKRSLPEMEFVDMRKELLEGNASAFSKSLLSALNETLESGNQAMLYINRRAYASFVRCKACGYVPKCTDCEVSLKYHKEENRLKCHYCGKQFHYPAVCPECGGARMTVGHMGTEAVASELSRLFPQAKIARLDRDTTAGKDAAAKILDGFLKGEAQILVGTQMIVKGHDFKNVTLVGVLDADLGLYALDYKSNEVTFQQITQVAGRAGRDAKVGRVIVQTYSPNHYVFRYANAYDYRGFFDKECEIRKLTKFPPFSTIARVLIRSKVEQNALTAARICYNLIRDVKEAGANCFRVQAMRAPVTRIENEYRFQVVAWLNADDKEALKKIYNIASQVNKKDVVSFVEVNPTNMR